MGCPAVKIESVPEHIVDTWLLLASYFFAETKKSEIFPANPENPAIGPGYGFIPRRWAG
jgi:hypothetical protein